MTWPSVTVVIPTFNGDVYLDEVLTAVESQTYGGEVDTLVIDSGSRDGTLAIIESHPAVRLIQIPNAEFGHGRTRNLAAQEAGGEIVAYLTQDAIPAHDRWLQELLTPFVHDERIAGVLGRQIPRPTCVPLLKYEIVGVFSGLGPDNGVTVVGPDFGGEDTEAKGFYSDVNSAARRAVLTGEVPYRDVKYAEDQLFGRDLLAHGYRKAYAGAGAVVHSNDLRLSEYAKRIFDETVGLREIGMPVAPLGRGRMFTLMTRGIVADTVRILRDPDYGWRRRLSWLVINPWFHVAKWRGFRRASRLDLGDSDARRRFSLEASRASGE